jgi:hypothetical protein
VITVKDILLQTGVIVALVLGLINVYFNLKTTKRTLFVNAVTAERVKWIAQIRHNVSILCSLCNQWILHRTQEKTPELQREIERMRNEVRLQLNPKDIDDVAIEHLLTQLPSWTNPVTPEMYRIIENDLIQATQRMLKREWDKVKDEAVHGDLR